MEDVSYFVPSNRMRRLVAKPAKPVTHHTRKGGKEMAPKFPPKRRKRIKSQTLEKLRKDNFANKGGGQKKDKNEKSNH